MLIKERGNTLFKTSDFTLIERVEVPNNIRKIKAKKIYSPKKDATHAIRVDLEYFTNDDRRGVIQSLEVGEKFNVREYAMGKLGDRIMNIDVLQANNISEERAKKIVKTNLKTWIANNLNHNMAKERARLDDREYQINESYRQEVGKTNMYPNYHNTKRNMLNEQFDGGSAMKYLHEGRPFTQYDYCFSSARESLQTAFDMIGVRDNDIIFVYTIQ